MGVMDNIPSITVSKSSAQNGISEADRKTIVLGGWLVGAVMLVFSNRYVLIDLQFGAPITLVAWQTFAVLVVSQVLSLQQKLSDTPVSPGNVISWELYATNLLPIGALLGVIPMWSTIASTSLPIYQMAILYGLTPLIAAIMSSNLGARITMTRFLYIVAIMIALMIATVGGIRFGKYDTQLTERQIYGAGWTKHEQIKNVTAYSTGTLTAAEILGSPSDTTATIGVDPVVLVNTVIALLCGLFAVAAEAGSRVLMEVMLKAREDRMSPSRLLTNVAPIKFVVVAITAYYMESGIGASLFSLPSGILLSNGIAGVIVAYSIPVVIQMTSATTYILADSFRQTFVAFLACVIYNIPIGILHAISYFVGLVGFAKYAEREIPRDAKKKPSDYALVSHSARVSESETDREANKPEPSQYEEDKVAEARGASVNMFIVLCGILLAVLVMASMTARPVLSTAQAMRYEQTISIPYEKSKVATIIEPRNLPHLGPLLLQFLTVLPPDWPILVWCSPENIEVLRQIPAISRNIDEGRLELRLFPHQFDIHDQEYLSRFLTKPWFWETIKQEWILFFQSDSMLCSKSPQKIDDWLGFDWVGAPWQDSPDAHGGNGGLSIRKRSSMIKLTSNPDIARDDYGDAEDVWFSKHLAELPGVVWPTEHQAKFSVENIFGAMSEWSWRPLGVHSGGTPPSTWRTEEVMNRLMDWCPELKLFYDPRKYIGT